MHTLLVTVDYLNDSLDLALSAEAPLSELLPILLEVCGLAQREASSSEEWELTLYGGEALPLTRSLEGCGVFDGTRLVLKRAAAQESTMNLRLPGRVHVFPYPPATSETEGPRVRWIHDDPLNE
ncbi:MAG TPA: EsaB/YukD family protein [Ktedonobacterales bacterium]|jgi:hypothetical protein